MEHDILHSIIITMTVAIAGGMTLIMIADALKLPSIGFLLVGGMILGPEVLGIVQPADLGVGLRVFVAMAVGIILFEGSIGLNFNAIKHTPGAIRGLLSVGTVVTWIGCAVVLYVVCGVPAEVALLCGSLIIVSGPTVIGPLLQKVRVRQKLKHLLHWEGVLIDPIGVFVALLCFEFFMQEGSTLHHFEVLLARVAIGFGFGLVGGYLMEKAFVHKLMHKSIYNVFFLSFAIMLFGISDILVSEAGILTVVVAGSWLSYRIGKQLKGVVHFHEEIVRLIAGIVFILLSANLKFAGFAEVGLPGILAIFLILLLVRPANVFISTARSSNLDLREKLFLSWLNPRGIVAASMASLFALIMSQRGNEYAVFLESFVFMVIISTVLIHGFLTGLVAKLLKVEEEPRTDWLVLGNNALAYGLARFIQSTDRQVTLMDREVNYDLYRETDKFELITADPLDEDVLKSPKFDRVGFLIAATENRDLNILASQTWAEELLEEQNTYYLCIEPMASHHCRPMVMPGKSLGQLNNDLLQGNLTLVTHHVDEEHGGYKDVFSKEGELLMMRLKDQVAPPDMRLLENADEALFMVRHRVPLSQFVKSNLIFTRVPTSNVVYFLLNCVELVVNNSQSILSHHLEQLLLKSEPLRSSYLGNGIALPRVASPEVLEPLVAVFQIPEGVEYLPMSKEMTHLVFLAILPEARSNLIKDITKELENIRDNDEMRQNLVQANTAAELFLMLHSADGEWVPEAVQVPEEDLEKADAVRIDQDAIDSLFD